MSLITNLKPNAILDKSITKQKLSDDINLIFDNTEKHLTDIQHELTVTSNPILEEFTFEPHNQDSGVAQINSIHGNSVVWNQLATQPEDNIGKVGETKNLVFNRQFLPKNNHVYLCTVYQKETLTSCERNTFQVTYNSESGVKSKYEATFQNYNLNKGLRGWFFTLNDANNNAGFIGLWVHSPNIDVAYENFQLHDLTKMFGAGNEPTTVEEFELLYGNMPSEYNEGEIIDNKVSSIKSVGTNIWNEEWEVGVYKFWDKGQKTTDGYEEYIRSSNFINVIQNAEYCFSYNIGTDYNVGCYDKNNEYISLVSVTNSKRFTVPANCVKIAFYAKRTTYNHDICINLSDESINGKYFPYEDFVRELPTIEGGLKSAGSVCDEIRYNVSTDKWEYVKRIGSVDLGTLSWRIKDTGNTNVVFITLDYDQWPENMKYTNTYNALSGKYFIKSEGATGSVFNNLEDKTIGFYYENGQSGRAIYIRDTLYTDLTTFTESLQGVILYYELAEPIVTELSDDYNLSYQISKCGTVEAISDGLSSPFKGEIEYSTTIANKINSNIRQIEYLDNKIDEVSDSGNQIKVTYDELVSLRNNSKLKPGCWYRIIDYVTTTSQENTQSAGHQFDVLVLATDVNVLSEEARACKKQFNIEDFKDAYSYSYDEKMIYNGTYEYNGKIYYHYKSQNDDGIEMLLDFNNLDIDVLVHEFEHPYCYYPTYGKYKTDENWEEGYDFGENIHFKTIVDYFASSNLNAWKIWYCLDNDESRFVWADGENGSGVIYRMIDEWNNDCPYDFKNIQFNRIVTSKGMLGEVIDYSNSTIKSELLNSDGETFKTQVDTIHNVVIDNDSDFYTPKDENRKFLITRMSYEYDPVLDKENLALFAIDYHEGDDINELEEDEIDYLCYRGRTTIEGNEYDLWQEITRSYGSNDVTYNPYNVYVTTDAITNVEEVPKKYLYTFSWIDLVGKFGDINSIYDFSIKGNNGDLKTDEDVISGCYGNEIGNYRIEYTESDKIQYGLNDNVFLSKYTKYDQYGTYNNILDINCNGNSFGDCCYNNTFANGCNNNSIGYDCNNNTFANTCYNNSIGDYCINNTFGNNCSDNTFGEQCINNSFGNYCKSNTFGYSCDDNTFGNNCSDNTFGEQCINNSIGDYCINNTFGNNCKSNTFGNNCYSNSFGNNCYSNIFGNDCYDNLFKNDCYNNSFGNNCYSNTFGEHFAINTFGNNCHGNSFGSYCSSNSFGDYYEENKFYYKCVNNSFCNGCYSNTFNDNCNNNSFGNDCYKNTFDYDCNNNSFGNNCRDNTFGEDCDCNSFGNGCFNNTFGEDCNYNSFGNSCYSNSFDRNCFRNSFSNNFYRNSLGASCYQNSFGNYCLENTFGDGCWGNSFGNECYRNSFGDNCSRNSFGNDCKRNSFRMDSSNDSQVRSYCVNNIFETGVSYVNLYNISTASDSYKLQNITVCQGMSGTNNSFNNVEIPTLNASYQIKVAKNSAGSIKVYCEADLIGDDE